MQANELRIGNFVRNDIGNNVKLNIISFLDQQYDEFNEFEPIPITEEWLKRFGFRLAETDYNGYKILGKEGFYILTNGIDFRHCIYGCLLDMNSNIKEFDKIEFVHDLQNLFYALNRKELTIK